ncbi:MAG TPA: cation diffusion facilitator family transporter [Allosphingosinicella sp.]|nr:cation diffusion facilitator family transporter [Allosphingosinicella sp.]
MTGNYPPHVEAGIRTGKRLEYWTIAWLVTVVPLMALVVGPSQAMKTVWIEDMLGFVPPIVYLISVRLEKKAPTRAFPYGFDRVNSLAFIMSAVALTSMGAYLLFEAVMTLSTQEHPTVGTMRLFGRDIWMGWPMIAVLLWSTIPSMILGWLKLPVARAINDKVLHTDADMQKADWMTGFAAIGGVIGIGFGLWWADALAAGLISLGILRDGITELRASTAELVDGAPRKLEKDEIADEAEQLRDELERLFPGAEVRLRETGRVIRAQVTARPPDLPVDLQALWPGDPDRSWRLAQLSFAAPGSA